MSRFFLYTSTEYLTGTAPLTAPPLTMSCWCYTGTTGLDEGLVFIGDQGSDNDHWGMYLSTTDYLQFRRRTSSSATVASTSQYTTNTWYHCAGTTNTASDSNYAYLNGEQSAEQATIRIPNAGNVDTMSVGAWRRSTDGLPFWGSIAEVAIWSVELTPAEIGVLAAGYSQSQD